MKEEIRKYFKNDAGFFLFFALPGIEEQMESFYFTERESEVFKMLITGVSTVDIAKELFITEKTVRYHITNIYSKTGTKVRIELFAKINNN